MLRGSSSSRAGVDFWRENPLLSHYVVFNQPIVSRPNSTKVFAAVGFTEGGSSRTPALPGVIGGARGNKGSDRIRRPAALSGDTAVPTQFWYSLAGGSPHAATSF